MKRIGEVVGELKNEGFSPNAMLAPLDMYVEYIQRWLAEDPRSIQWVGQPRETLVVDGSRLSIFWSNNYVRFNDFAILASATGEWVIKPDPETGKALRVRISRSSLYPETRVEVIAKTVVHYELESPNGIRVLKLT